LDVASSELNNARLNWVDYFKQNFIKKGVEMFHKIAVGLLVVSMSAVFGMSLEELNSASKEELTTIKGVGEAKAEAIIAERSKKAFESFEDLQRVKGVGKQLAQKIQETQK
jgi:competence protein ComEA